VIIVGRGGGGKEDLWAFNDERVARAVVACGVPVISAVGHEVDMTVCDAVADLRAPTPSAAAAAACASGDDVRKALVLAGREMSAAMSETLRGGRRDLAGMRGAIVQSSLRAVSSRRLSLSSSAARLNALSPLATLSRGYAVARDAEGATLTSARQFTAGMEFGLVLHDGSIKAKTSGASEGEGGS
jgi:exodeoxyribonuclease VII large subunit